MFTINDEDLDNVRVTFHAQQAMVNRHVTLTELCDVLTKPEIVECQPDDRARFVRGELCAVVAFDEPEHRPVVISLLLRRREAWSNHDARTRSSRTSPRKAAS